MKKVITTLLMAAMLFAGIPTAFGGITVNAASPYWKNVKAKAATETSVRVSWKKLTKKQQKKIHGIAVFCDGKAVKKLKKSVTSYTDKNLTAGKHIYQLKTFRKSSKKVKVYWNKKSGKWQTKKINGAKSKRVRKTIYKYANASQKLTVTTKENSEATAPQNVKAVYTGEKGNGKGGVTVSWNKVSGAEFYWVHNNFGEPKDSDDTHREFTLPLGKTYTFQVTAVIDGKESPKSKEVSITLPADTTQETTDPVTPVKPQPVTPTPTTPEPVTPTPEKKMVKITDYEGTVRTVEEGSADYKNPLYNRNIDGIVYYNGGKKPNIIQKNGVTFKMTTASDYALGFGIYNGDYKKVSYELSVPEVKYTVWSGDLYSPTKETATCVLGDHGRRVAKVDRNCRFEKDINAYVISIALREGYCGPICDTLNLNIIMKYDGKVIYTHPAILGHDNDEYKDSNGLYGITSKFYNIAKDAIKLYKNGGGVPSWPQERYIEDKNKYGNYIAEMRAIEYYVNHTYPYSEIDCWGGEGILRIYSVMDYGIYGHTCFSVPSNTSHHAFRPDYSCENGNFSGEFAYFQTQGHD